MKLVWKLLTRKEINNNKAINDRKTGSESCPPQQDFLLKIIPNTRDKQMGKIKLFLILFISAFYFSCDNISESIENTDYKLKTENAKYIVKENNKFAFDFFKEVASFETKSNYMVSPVSLSLALGMVYNGTNGETKTAFDQVLNYNAPLLEVNQFNKNLINKLSSNADGSVMEIANSIWIKKKFPVKKEFINLNKDYYYAKVQNLDFNNPAAVVTINNWVSNKTHEKIPSIIDNISSREVLFLINVLYFNANWKNRFNVKDTHSDSFYKNETETIQVEMMKIKEKIKYFQNELFSSIILPYEKDKFSMVILLPNEQKSTKDIISNLSAENWGNWLNNYNSEKITVTIPKFKLDYKNKLNAELISIGLSIAFTDDADFNGISDTQLLITSVLQKTFIDVNEKGTEAAAATSIGIGTTSIGIEPKSFYANKPFIYVIKENVTGSICFIGKVGEPKY